jgi:molecular chaperone HscC
MGTQKRLLLGSKSFAPEDLSALVLRSLKADAEAFLGEPVSEAVIAVPAYFNDKQRKATRSAGQLAGLKIERLINEPTAAALAYGIAERDRDTRFLVFDLGGGTFDVSILEIYDGVIEVRASAGDNRLGGEDFNEVLVDLMAHHFSDKWGAEFGPDSHLYHRVRAAAERARRLLTTQDFATMSVVWDGRQDEMEVTAAAFESGSEKLLAKMRNPILRSLHDGRIRPEEIDEIVLVGGATRMPLIRRTVTKMFNRFPSTAVDPDLAVARGAAVQAALKARDAAFKEVVLTDVCPYTLGIAVLEWLPNGGTRDNIFAPIIERNTTIPASRAKTFVTVSDHQEKILIRVYQGEARDVAGNISLGQLSIPVPPRPAGQVEIECRFTYDINGLLEVDVQIPETGERRDLVIADDEGELAENFEERRSNLAALKIYPRDEDINRATSARAGRCFEESLGDQRYLVSQMTTRFEAALESQDPKTIMATRADLVRVLDQLEGRPVL